jgi:hypothetical protein
LTFSVKYASINIGTFKEIPVVDFPPDVKSLGAEVMKTLKAEGLSFSHALNAVLERHNRKFEKGLRSNIARYLNSRRRGAPLANQLKEYPLLLREEILLEEHMDHPHTRHLLSAPDIE